jgi:heme-degrading monooxygenase HmoA
MFGNGTELATPLPFRKRSFTMQVLHIDAKLKPGRREDFLKVFNSLVLPLLKKQPGFVDEILLFEDGNDAGIGLSIWESRDDAERYLHNVFQKAKSNMEHLIDGEVAVRSFEIEASEVFQIKSRKAA